MVEEEELGEEEVGVKVVDKVGEEEEVVGEEGVGMEVVEELEEEVEEVVVVMGEVEVG